MDRIFLKILEMNLAGTACILIVLALRLLLKRKPRSFSYVLWAVVFLRLLCPFTLQSRYFGLALGNMEQRLETAAYEQELVQYQMLVHKDGTVESLSSRGRMDILAAGTDKAADFYQDSLNAAPAFFEHYQGVDWLSADAQNQREQISRRYSRSEVLFQERRWVAVGSLIWMVGVTVLIGYSLVSYLLLRRRLRQAVRIQEDVYESDRISTPFLLGIFDPRIYLPVGLPQEERAYVLAHELVHMKRGDYLIKAVTWLTLSLHWFNPLVWLAYGLMVRDMEMSCDERVIRQLGEGSKKAYSNALLAISGASQGGLERRVLTAAPLSFGENDIRSRVKNILAYRSVKIGTGVIMAVLLAAGGLVLMTDWSTPEEGGSKSMPGEEQSTPEKQPDSSGTLEEYVSAEERRSDNTVWTQNAPGTDISDGGIQVSPGQQTEVSDGTQMGSLAALQAMDRGGEMTWEQLQTLVERKNPRLEDYAGYAGASWLEDDENDSSRIARMFYLLEDADNGQSYRLDIYYWKENLNLDSVYLFRESDWGTLMLYSDRVAEGKGLYRNMEIAAFRRDIRHLSDWVSDWDMPHEEQIEVGPYRTDFYIGSGVLFDWKAESRDLEDSWAPEAWKSAGGFIQVYRGDDEQSVYDDIEPFVFDENGRLNDFYLRMNHSEITGDSEVLEGCQEQAVLVSMNHDLYTVSDLDEMEEAGTPIPEEETTVDIWYVGFAREDAPYGYVLFLAERYFTREEVIAMAQSVRFTETAWAADSVSP